MNPNGHIEVKSSSFFYAMTWTIAQSEVSILLDHFHEQSRTSLIRAEVKVSFPNSQNPLAAVDHVTINSGRSKTTLVNTLNRLYPPSTYPDIKWQDMVSQICLEAFLHRRQGEPVQVVGNQPITEDAHRWQAWPFVPKGEPAIIFGDGDSGKSLISVAIGTCVQYGIAKLGIRPIQGKVLVMDWETSAAEYNRRLKGMQPMFGLPSPPILDYMFCYRPLVEQVERLALIVAERNISMIIVDNIGAAIPGSANDDDVARDFMNALRELKVSALCIAHDVKNKLPGRKPMPFGSSFWHNRGRQIFRAVKEQARGSDEFIVALHHTKSNVGPSLRPVGFHVHWNDLTGEITIKRSDDDIYSSPTLIRDLTLQERITQLLRRGSMSVRDIAEELTTEHKTITPAHARTILNRGLGRYFVKVPDGWGNARSETGA